MRNTILHRSKYLAVSAGLNRVVSVRNSILLWEGITLYFSPTEAGVCVRTFLTNLRQLSYPTPTLLLYKTCIFFATMLYCFCECEAEVILSDVTLHLS